MSAKAQQWTGDVDEDAESDEILSDDAENSMDDAEGSTKDEEQEAVDEDQEWESNFNRLVEFKSREGHCLVPFRYKHDRPLGKWVAAQRKIHQKVVASGQKTPAGIEERFRRLDEIGFQWTAKDPRHVPWSQRYRELVEFVERFGHAQVPIGWKENRCLSNWVSAQRQEYRALLKGRPSRLTKDRVRLLNDVNFIFEARRGGPRRQARATDIVPLKPTPAKGSEERRANLLESIEHPDSPLTLTDTGVHSDSPQLRTETVSESKERDTADPRMGGTRQSSIVMPTGIANHPLSRSSSSSQENTLFDRLIAQSRSLPGTLPMGAAMPINPLAVPASNIADTSSGYRAIMELEAMAQLNAIRRISNAEAMVRQLIGLQGTGLDRTFSAQSQESLLPMAQAPTSNLDDSGRSIQVPGASVQDPRMFSIIPLATPPSVEDAGYQYALVPRSLLQDLRARQDANYTRDDPMYPPHRQHQHTR